MNPVANRALYTPHISGVNSNVATASVARNCEFVCYISLIITDWYGSRSKATFTSRLLVVHCIFLLDI